MPRKYTPDEALAAFWSRVDKSGGPDACWPWLGWKHPPGNYGRTMWHGSPARAHRLAFILSGGVLAESAPLVLHGGGCTMHNGGAGGLCCNPAHLSAGDFNDNNGRDRDRDGTTATGDRNGARLHPERLARGSATGNAKLTEADIPVIRGRRARGEQQKDIARSYGVDFTTISRIVRRTTWGHVE